MSGIFGEKYVSGKLISTEVVMLVFRTEQK